MSKKKSLEKLKDYHFEFKHITVLFIILFLFQLMVSFVNKASIKHFLNNTQEWYQKDAAEKLANVTTTSLELLLESLDTEKKVSSESSEKIIQSFNIILSQQALQHNIEQFCVIVNKDNKYYAIDEGKALYTFLVNNEIIDSSNHYDAAIKMYKNIGQELKKEEQIRTITTDNQTFNIFVPFMLRGGYIGAVYIKNTSNFSFISNQIISSYDETSIIYLSLIMLGLLAMYFISSYTVKERDEAQKLLYEENEKNLTKQIHYEKELVFTKRIYHTHHKAEKIMGFIKEDLRKLSPANINETNYRVTKYSNFISRVIYDMKWYDPPVQTIRNQIFNTNLNEVIKFIVDNIFLRLSTKSNAFEIKLELDENITPVHVNEFVIWEILEPLIQNSIEHGGDQNLIIKIKTYVNNEGQKIISISDNGKGISPDLLILENGIKRLFQENISTKTSSIQNSGYGCYIAYEITRRCGWQLDAANIPDGGCAFIITIKD
ncbi:MAG TPA: ATP-binding protein [Ignavibacteriaceae bacterium]|nr:ATP-binding protein [Ignavibacteriaceae bacterium]